MVDTYLQKAVTHVTSCHVHYGRQQNTAKTHPFVDNAAVP